MAAVTYIPRALPALIIHKMHIAPKMEKILGAIPYAALGALIFPGILSVDEKSPVIGIVGGGVALILAYFKLNITYIILGAVLSVITIKGFWGI